jgi:hypothetical protein
VLKVVTQEELFRRFSIVMDCLFDEDPVAYTANGTKLFTAKLVKECHCGEKYYGMSDRCRPCIIDDRRPQMSKPRKTDIRAKQIYLCRRAGKTLKQIAEAFGLSTTTVRDAEIRYCRKLANEASEKGLDLETYELFLESKRKGGNQWRLKRCK